MSNEHDWIDFNLVKQSVSMEMLIIHFGLYPIHRKGDEVRLKCPFHHGKSDNSMTINLVRNSFYCFGCQARGGVIDFVAHYENCQPREAAQQLIEWFQIGESEPLGQPGREVSLNETVPPLTPAHLISSIEHQLAQLKKLILPS